MEKINLEKQRQEAIRSNNLSEFYQQFIDEDEKFKEIVNHYHEKPRLDVKETTGTNYVTVNDLLEYFNYKVNQPLYMLTCIPKTSKFFKWVKFRKPNSIKPFRGFATTKEELPELFEAMPRKFKMKLKEEFKTVKKLAVF